MRKLPCDGLLYKIEENIDYLFQTEDIPRDFSASNSNILFLLDSGLVMMRTAR